MLVLLSFLQIFLQTMSKYVLEVLLKTRVSQSQEVCLPLPDTTFIAMSAYHKCDVTQLKIQHNHYVKNAYHTAKSPLPYSLATDSNVARATPHPAAPKLDYLVTNCWPPLPNWSYSPYLQPQNTSPCKALVLCNHGIDLFPFLFHVLAAVHPSLPNPSYLSGGGVSSGGEDSSGFCVGCS